MYICLGGETVVSSDDIIAVLDMERVTANKDTVRFLNVAEEEGFIRPTTDDIPKSFVVAERGKRSSIYLSPLRPVTICERLSQGKARKG